DDFAAVGGVQIDPFPSCREQGVGEQGAVEDTAHGERAAPVMVRLQPGDIGRDRGRAGLDAAVISIDGTGSRGRLARRVVEKGADIIMQGAPAQRDDQDENLTIVRSASLAPCTPKLCCQATPSVRVWWTPA